MTENQVNEEFIEIAVITGPHALNGRLKIFLFTDIKERFFPGNTVYLQIKNNYVEYKVAEFSNQKKGYYRLTLEGVNDRNSAEALRGIKIFINKSTAEETRGVLDEESFFYFDLIGCSVIRENKQFGEITEVLDAGGGTVLVIKKEDKEYLLPFVESMVDVRDIKDKIIYIDPVEGLFDI